MLVRMMNKIGVLVEKEPDPTAREILQLLCTGLTALVNEEQRFFGEKNENDQQACEELTEKESIEKTKIVLLVPSERRFYAELYASAFRKFDRAIKTLKKSNPSFPATELEDEIVLLTIHLEVLQQNELNYQDLIRYRDFKEANKNGLQIDPALRAFLLATLNPPSLKLVREQQRQINKEIKDQVFTKNRHKEMLGFKQFQRELLKAKDEAEKEKQQLAIEQEIARQTADIVCVEQSQNVDYRLYKKPREAQSPRRPAELNFVEEYEGEQKPASPIKKDLFQINLAVALKEDYKKEEDSLNEDDFEELIPTPPKPNGKGK